MKIPTVPYRSAIYWRLDELESGPMVTIYHLSGLIRLNRVASSIWLLLDGRHGREQIANALQERFPHVPIRRLREDVGLFLSQAQDRGLIVRHWSPLQPYEVIAERFIS